MVIWQALHKYPWNRYTAFLVFLLVAAVVSYYFVQLRFDLMVELDVASIDRLVKGEAPRVYQVRYLAPWLIDLAHKAMPEFQFPLAHLARGSHRTPLQDMQRLFETATVFLSIVAFRYYLSLFVKARGAALSIMAMSLPLVLLFHYTVPRWGQFRYPFDLPSVLFFILGLILIYKSRDRKKNWLLYYPLFIVATYNLESTVWLSVIFLFTALPRISLDDIRDMWHDYFKKGKIPPKLRTIACVVCHCLVQLALWTAVRYHLHIAFGYYAGFGALFRHASALPGNLQYVRNLANWPFLFSNFGYTWIIAFLLYHKLESPFLRNQLLVLVPFVPAWMHVALIGELRAFGGMTPVVLATGASHHRKAVAGTAKRHGLPRQDH